MIHLFHQRFEQFKPDFRADLVIADPPDNLNKPYKDVSDLLPDNDYRRLLKEWLRKCCEMCDGAVFFTFNEKWIPEIEDAIREKNIMLVQRLMWFYTFGQHHTRRYGSCFRPVYWLNRNVFYPNAVRVQSARQIKYSDKRGKPGGKLPENVWTFSRICGTFKERRKWHECQLPEKMIERIINGHSREGEIVFDPFIGSGTTAIVAKRLKRDCIGIDASEYYIQKAQEELDSI